MNELGDYHQRLADIVATEQKRLGIGRAELSRRIGLGRAALNKWVNFGLKGEIDYGTVGLLADYLGKDRESLQNYLYTGEWLPDRKSDTEKLADRVAALERTVQTLTRRPAIAESPGRYQVNADGLRSMTVLGVEMQNAVTAMGRDWRCTGTIKAMHAKASHPKSEGGLSIEPDISLRRFQDILWGLTLPTDAEIPEVRIIILGYTSEPEVWTCAYVNALVTQGYVAGSLGLPTNRIAAR